MVDAVNNEALLDVEYEEMDLFNLQIPKSVPNVPDELLHPR